MTKIALAVFGSADAKKCAPTIILLKAIMLAKKIKKYLILGRSTEKHKATTKIGSQAEYFTILVECDSNKTDFIN